LEYNYGFGYVPGYAIVPDMESLGIAVDANGAVFVTGYFSGDATDKNAVPTTPGVVQANYGGLDDAFVLKLQAAAVLSLDPPSLDFQTTVGAHNPDPQTVTLKNISGVPQDWHGDVSTSNGRPWLTVTPLSGTLTSGQSVTLTVSIDASRLSANFYA